jgi:hypothetical protein
VYIDKLSEASSMTINTSLYLRMQEYELILEKLVGEEKPIQAHMATTEQIIQRINIQLDQADIEKEIRSI